MQVDQTCTADQQFNAAAAAAAAAEAEATTAEAAIPGLRSLPASIFCCAACEHVAKLPLQDATMSSKGSQLVNSAADSVTTNSSVECLCWLVCLPVLSMTSAVPPAASAQALKYDIIRMPRPHHEWQFQSLIHLSIVCWTVLPVITFVMRWLQGWHISAAVCSNVLWLAVLGLV
jgi:hypothetical protein